MTPSLTLDSVRYFKFFLIWLKLLTSAAQRESHLQAGLSRAGCSMQQEMSEATAGIGTCAKICHSQELFLV